MCARQQRCFHICRIVPKKAASIRKLDCVINPRRYNERLFRCRSVISPLCRPCRFRVRITYRPRIVCLTGVTTETLYSLGEQERIAGISGFCVRTPEARREKQKASAFERQNRNNSRVATRRVIRFFELTGRCRRKSQLGEYPGRCEWTTLRNQIQRHFAAPTRPH